MNRGTPHHGATAWQVMDRKRIETDALIYNMKSFEVNTLQT